MNHTDHVALLRPAGLSGGGLWADLGAGTGAFTLALRELLGPQATIFAVDRNRGDLSHLERAYARRFENASRLHLVHADLNAPLGLPPLEGALMANSLHFFKDQDALLVKVRGLLKPGGVLLVVEYNVDRGNAWVPFPLSFGLFETRAARAGFEEARLLARHPSSFLKELYSARAQNP